MTNRRSRGSVKPRGSERLERVDVMREPIRGLHQGQQLRSLQQQAGYMTALDRAPHAAATLRPGGRPYMTSLDDTPSEPDQVEVVHTITSCRAPPVTPMLT